MNRRKWLIINYTLPTDPSRPRVATWRALKKLGAVNIQQSMWVLANNEDNFLSLQKISQDIEDNSGDALLMESVFFNENQEERVISNFNNIRNEEFKELISECRKYLKELEKEISIKKFTFAELEEEEEELNKLIAWFAKIKARDIFNSDQGALAEKMLVIIKEAFEKYNDLVYRAQEK